VEKPTALEAGSQKVGLLFFLNIIYINSAHAHIKSQSYVNFKGIKFALKNLGRFSSPTASRAVSRGKYQHSDLYLKYKTLRSYNFE
jgi:hypothetical protein